VIASFIGCQDICKNALHWLLLEVLPKSGFWGKNGEWLTFETNDTLGYLPSKHVMRCIERQAAFYGLLCTASKEQNKMLSYRRLYLQALLRNPPGKLSNSLKLRGD